MGFGDALVGAGSGAASGSAAGPWGAVIGAGIGLFGSLFGAHEQSQASEQAAQINAQAQLQIAQMNAAAQKYAADLQAKASSDALNFSKAGAENSFQNNEVSRAGNYDQWAAAQRRVGSVAKLLGFGDREIPAYRPGVDPNFGGSGGDSASSVTGAVPSSFGNLSDPTAWMGLVSDPTKLSAFVKGVAPSMDPGLVSYYVGKIQGQPGANPAEQAGSAQYWANKIASDPTLRSAAPNPYSVSQFL